MINKLYVVGDSFSADDSPNTWVRIISQRMNYELKNFSMDGTSQDYAWFMLDQIIPKMGSDDRLIVVLTHPNRVWYFQDKPYLSNINCLDLDRYVEKEAAKAVELYIKHIQRVEIDCLRLNQRLGWLSWQTSVRKLKTPLCIFGFSQIITDNVCTQGINLSQGSLYEIQMNELVTSLDMNELWRGIDCRYNHLCLRNHQILSEKIVSFFETNSIVDLENGFHKHFLSDKELHNLDFVHKELNIQKLKKCLEMKKNKKPYQDWKERVGIPSNFGG